MKETTSTRKTSKTRSTSKKTKSKKNEFFIGDIVSLGLMGMYKVEGEQKIEAGGSEQKYFVLCDIYSNAIHKTYLPVGQIALKARKVTTRVTKKKMDKIIENMELLFEDIDQNSNKKIKSYEKRIVESGFEELVHSYFCVKYDLEVNEKTDKRYIQFSERLKKLVVEEIAASNKMTKEEACEFFEAYNKTQTSH